MVKRSGYEGLSEVLSVWEEFMPKGLSAIEELNKLDELYVEKKISKSMLSKLYNRTKHWKALRRKILKRDGYSCVRCKSRVNLQVHHLRYAGRGNEKMEDLVTFCGVCHQSVSSNNVESSMRAHRRVVEASAQLFEVMRK